MLCRLLRSGLVRRVLLLLQFDVPRHGQIERLLQCQLMASLIMLMSYHSASNTAYKGGAKDNGRGGAAILPACGCGKPAGHSADTRTDQSTSGGGILTHHTIFRSCRAIVEQHRHHDNDGRLSHEFLSHSLPLVQAFRSTRTPQGAEPPRQCRYSLGASGVGFAKPFLTAQRAMSCLLA